MENGIFEFSPPPMQISHEKVFLPPSNFMSNYHNRRQVGSLQPSQVVMKKPGSEHIKKNIFSKKKTYKQKSSNNNSVIDVTDDGITNEGSAKQYDPIIEKKIPMPTDGDYKSMLVSMDDVFSNAKIGKDSPWTHDNIAKHMDTHGYYDPDYSKINRTISGGIGHDDKSGHVKNTMGISHMTNDWRNSYDASDDMVSEIPVIKRSELPKSPMDNMFKLMASAQNQKDTYEGATVGKSPYASIRAYDELMTKKNHDPYERVGTLSDMPSLYPKAMYNAHKNEYKIFERQLNSPKEPNKETNANKKEIKLDKKPIRKIPEKIKMEGGKYVFIHIHNYDTCEKLMFYFFKKGYVLPIQEVEGKITQEEEDKDRACAVCEERTKKVAIIPCGHVCLCIECMYTIVYTAMCKIDGSEPECPICKIEFKKCVRVFI